MLELKLLPKAILDLGGIYEYTLISWGLNQVKNIKITILNLFNKKGI